jgi:hypothetical protein
LNAAAQLLIEMVSGMQTVGRVEKEMNSLRGMPETFVFNKR